MREREGGSPKTPKPLSIKQWILSVLDRLVPLEILINNKDMGNLQLKSAFKGHLKNEVAEEMSFHMNAEFLFE